MISRRAFIVGHPIAHSRSPLLHRHWLDSLGIQGSYQPLDVRAEDLAAFVAGLREAGWVGGNVTVPHKTAVIAHLDGIDAAAAAVGAVNTLWWEGDRLLGGNTDAIGFLGNLDEQQPGWDRSARRAVILGAGGAARAVVYALRSRGLDIALCNRSVGKAEALEAHFSSGVSAHGLEDRTRLLAACDLLVNTTSLGMSGQPPLDLDLGPLPPGAIVCDVVYVPLETPLLSQAKAKGHPTVDGLGMLLHQGVDGFGRWFGQRPRVTAELRELLADDIRAKTAGG